MPTKKKKIKKIKFAIQIFLHTFKLCSLQVTLVVCFQEILTKALHEIRGKVEEANFSTLQIQINPGTSMAGPHSCLFSLTGTAG